jgi:hypothetical protein
VVRELFPLILENGRSKDTAQQLDTRLRAIGHPENMKAFRDALQHDLLKIDCPDYWQEIETTKTWLVEWGLVLYAEIFICRNLHSI